MWVFRRWVAVLLISVLFQVAVLSAKRCVGIAPALYDFEASPITITITVVQEASIVFSHSHRGLVFLYCDTLVVAQIWNYEFLLDHEDRNYEISIISLIKSGMSWCVLISSVRVSTTMTLSLLNIHFLAAVGCIGRSLDHCARTGVRVFKRCLCHSCRYLI